MSEAADMANEASLGHKTLAELGHFVAKRAMPVLTCRDEPAFVLATWPWKETSLIVELLTRSHGRVTVAARGAKRPAGRFRGLIDFFTPLLVSFSGRGEVKNLTGARWLGGLKPVSGEGLLTGFYLNELILKLTAREVVQPGLFEAYTRTLTQLASDEAYRADRAMRTFEVELLRLCGWGQRLEGEPFEGVVCNGEILEAPEAAGSGQGVYSREVVRAVLMADFSEEQTLHEARALLREIIEYYAGGKTLETRRTLLKWRRFCLKGEKG